MIEINNLKQTTVACPAQWEFRTFENRPVYVRYRWGALYIHIGSPNGDMDEAYTGETIFYEEIGNNADGFIEWGSVKQRLDNISKEDVIRMLNESS